MITDITVYDFLSETEPPAAQNEPAYWFLFHGDRLVAQPDGDNVSPLWVSSPAELGLHPIRSQFMGYLYRDETRIACYAGELSASADIPESYRRDTLRQLYTPLGDTFFSLAGRAIQIVAWDATHQYCGRCAAPLTALAYERAKKCGQCGLTSYPRISPAIIIAVTRQIDDVSHLLLARNHRFPANRYSIIAGFVEPGESLEECCAREVHEEVGIEITNIRYVASQPWPFPNSLMLGFTADYASGDIVLEEEEIAAADWFTPGNLPLLPPKPSIARYLIDGWLADQGH